MSYPSNAPGAYPYCAVAATNVPSGCSLSGAKLNETDYSADGGFASAVHAAYVEFVPRTYQQHHDQHGLVQAVNNPYPSHPQQEYCATLPHPAPLPNPDYEHSQEVMYAASVQQQQQQQQQHNNNNDNMQHQSPGSMAPPVPQPIHPSPMQDQRMVPVVPALPQTSLANRQQQTQQQQYQRIARFVGPPPVALACTECRARHLKCDAGIPACNRCQTDGRDCSYIKSRRGWKGTRRKKAAAAAAAAREEEGEEQEQEQEQEQEAKIEIEVDNPEAVDDAIPIAAPPPTRQLALNLSGSPFPLAATPAASVRSITSPKFAAAATTTATTTTTTTTTMSPLDTLRAYHKNSTKFPSPQDLPVQPPASANLLQLYYAYFHSAHPFILPPAQLITNSASQIAVLLTVIRFIASFFGRTSPTETFKREAEIALFTNTPARNAFTVQALLLFAIGLHSDNEQEKSAKVKDLALELALELGMNFKEFSESSYDGTQAGKVQAESWRRTWWELYYLDGLLAGFHRKDSFKLWSMQCTVALPCEERDYAIGRIPEPKSLQEFDDRYFALETTVFSSFAYRIDAVRILGQVLAVGQGSDPEDPKADAADASLVNWGLHLPECKKELVGQDRRVDEILFQAHMVVNAASIYLHRPKSHLATTDYADDTSCTPPEHWSASPRPQAMHTAKAITAANTIAKLITLPAPLIKHTPFFTCVITLAAIVHLSACSWLLTGDEGYLAKERIRLGVGALKTLGEIWGVADCVLMQVKGAARDVFALQIPVGTQRSGIITEEEVFRFIDEERTLEIVGGEADYHGLPELDWNGEWCII